MEEKIRNILEEPLVVINVGGRTFADSLQRQGVDVVQVDWAPPAAGDQKMVDLLNDLL